MTVEFIPKSEDCFAFAAPDGHWFELLRKPGVRAILGGLLIMTNDPADIDRETAVKLAITSKKTRMESCRSGPRK